MRHLLSDPAAAPQPRFAFSERARVWRTGRHGASGYAWRASAPVAGLLLLHGLRSHAQWFSEAAEELAGRGVSVYALDRRGSGSSPGRGGDIERYREWLEEIHDAAILARTEHPGLPIHLLGHCFGANLGLAYALTHPREVSSLVMLTPGLYVLPGYTPLERLEIAIAGALNGTKRFRMPQEDWMFSRDPEVLAWIESDRLGAPSVTARCLVQINRMGSWLRHDVGKLKVPVLVLAASRDRISDNSRNQRLLSAALGSRCRWRTFEGEHFLLAEPCRDQVIEAVLGWIRDEVN
jgi:alpha-beta hydrolase superfamily lysophospholipase